MLLKAGTYRFNDVPNALYNITTQEEFDTIFPIAQFSFNFVSNGINYTKIESMYANGTFAYSGLSFTATEFSSLSYSDDEGTISTQAYGKGTGFDGVTYSGWQNEAYKEHTIPEQEVDDTFGTWYISNTNYNEVNAPVEDTIYTEKSSWYKSVADAIRNKKGTTAPILRDDFASEISSITGGGETPYYDGTVIIEKPISVRGLRRWNETLTSFVVEVDEFGRVDNEQILSLYGFDITPLDVDGTVVKKISCLISVTYEGVTVEGFVLGCEGGYPTLSVDKDPILQMVNQFTVTATANSTVDEWLLANTEGVSV